MLPQDLNQLNEQSLLDLCTAAAPESQTLEFKRDLPARDNRGRSELLKDVCAFANTDGGDIIYGIQEQNSAAARLLPITNEPADQAVRRIAQILEAGVEPRTVGLQFHPVPLPGGYSLVVRVPPSFSGPHRFSDGGAGSRFVVRTGTHIVDLSYDQLRSAFDRTATLVEKARRFREERLGRIITGRTWRPLKVGPICVVHLVPISAMAGKVSLDVGALYGAYTPFMFGDWGGASRSLNLDGLVVHPGQPPSGEMATAYTQIYRSGALEAVRFAGRLIDDRKAIPSITVAAFIREAVQMFLEAQRRFRVSGPGVLSAALLRTDGYPFGHIDPYRFEVLKVADRSDLVLPELWIEQLDQQDVSVDNLAQRLLDILWQSFDLSRCQLFDEAGNWREPR